MYQDQSEKMQRNYEETIKYRYSRMSDIMAVL